LKPQETLYDHLVFALKYEGVNLLFFKKLFQKIEKVIVENLVKGKPPGQYSRKIRFLFEWLMQDQLDIPDLKAGNYVPLIDEAQQYASSLSIVGAGRSVRQVLNRFPKTSCSDYNKL
jgi:hypothetical protein